MFRIPGSFNEGRPGNLNMKEKFQGLRIQAMYPIGYESSFGSDRGGWHVDCSSWEVFEGENSCLS